MTDVPVWIARAPAEAVRDLGYVRAWSRKQRGVTADIASELAYFGHQAPARRSVLGFVAGHVGGLVEVKGGDFVAPDVLLRQRLLSAVIRGELAEQNGLPFSLSSSPIVAEELETLLKRRQWALVPSGRHDFRSTRRRDPTIGAVVPVSQRLGRISEFGGEYQLSFNSGYYIWLEEEFSDGYASSGDPIGLEVIEGVVTSPPIASRSALLRVLDSDGADRLVIRRVDVSNLTVTLPGGIVLHGESATCRCPADVTCARAEETGPVQIFSRARGATTTIEVPPGHVAFTLYGRQVCRVSSERADCPANGLVVMLGESARKPVIAGALRGGKVVYDLIVDNSKVISGTQVGPQVLRGGLMVDVSKEIEQGLEVYGAASEVGLNAALPPITLTPERIIGDRRGRAAVGITETGDICVAVAEGCEPRSMEPDVDMLGANIAEITSALKDRGCWDAVVLDSGGAANICLDGKLAVRPADRNDVVGVPFERYVPGAWRLAGSYEIDWRPGS